MDEDGNKRDGWAELCILQREVMHPFRIQGSNSHPTPECLGCSKQTQGGYSRWWEQRLGFWDPSLLGVQGIFGCLTRGAYGQRRSYTSA